MLPNYSYRNNTVLSYHTLIFSPLFFNPIMLYSVLSLSNITVNQRMTKKVVLKEYCAEIEMLKSQLQITREKNGYDLCLDLSLSSAFR